MYKTPDRAVPLTDSRLADQYNLNLAVLSGLGFDQREIETGVPPLEVVQSALSEADREWLDSQVAQGYAAQLTIAPSVQVIGLEGERHAPGLIPRFDLKQAGVRKGASVVRKEWREVGDKYPVHDNGFNEPFSAAILLTPVGQLDLGNGSEPTPEQVLRGIGKVADKIDALEKQHIEQARSGRRVVSAPINHLVTYEAQVRHAGERSFHHQNGSCLVHYPPLPGRKSDTRLTFYRTGRHHQHIELGSRLLFVANEAVLRTLHLPTATAATART